MSLIINKKIGFIGAGNMGQAIIARLSSAFHADALLAYDIDPEKTSNLQAHYKITACKDLTAIIKESDIVVLAVKPDTIVKVLTSIKDLIKPKQIIVSIAAGISIKKMEDAIGPEHKIIRGMPNTPAMIGEGMTVLSPNEKTDIDSVKIIELIFSKIGKVLVLPEKLMDAVTGLSGSGPAYVYTFIQALTDGGVKMGLPRDKSLILAAQTVIGSARMVLESGEDPITLRGKVTSPGGTTIQAVHVLERSGFSGIVIDAVESASVKSKELGEK